MAAISMQVDTTPFIRGLHQAGRQLRKVAKGIERMKPKLKPEELAAKREAEAKANAAATAHDEATAELHKAADERGVSAAWLAQQPEWKDKVKPFEPENKFAK